MQFISGCKMCSLSPLWALVSCSNAYRLWLGDVCTEHHWLPLVTPH